MQAGPPSSQQAREQWRGAHGDDSLHEHERPLAVGDKNELPRVGRSVRAIRGDKLEVREHAAQILRPRHDWLGRVVKGENRQACPVGQSRGKPRVVSSQCRKGGIPAVHEHEARLTLPLLVAVRNEPLSAGEGIGIPEPGWRIREIESHGPRQHVQRPRARIPGLQRLALDAARERRIDQRVRVTPVDRLRGKARKAVGQAHAHATRPLPYGREVAAVR